MSNMTTDLRFSMVPHWVTDSGISDRALRLYSVLSKFADSETGQAFPGRTRLSNELNCSLKSVDRAVSELIELGAVTKTQRVKYGHYQSSLYTVVRIDPASPGSLPRVTDDATPRQGRRDPVSPVTHRTITTEQDPPNKESLNDITRKFDQFWAAYPRKKGKGQARTAFEKALNKTDIETILAGVEAYKKNDDMDDPQFVAHPSTWLNGERWEDEHMEVTVVSKSPYVGGVREWVRDMHDMGEHFECRVGEFGCK